MNYSVFFFTAPLGIPINGYPGEMVHVLVMIVMGYDGIVTSLTSTVGNGYLPYGNQPWLAGTSAMNGGVIIVIGQSPINGSFSSKPCLITRGIQRV